ncbi:MAG: 7-carboxy-7-deazaguanine synthase QueE [Deltaproteobacteria bacterium]|nr:7-carboxy-7-deazaguanine synthase QueE [Deltaproteobacteria bacterium]
MSPKKAYLSEIFSSIQGEGLLAGLRQIFVRFSGCSLTCNYCDTPESRVQSPECKVGWTFPTSQESGVGSRENYYNIPNPVSPEKLTEIVNSFQTHQNLHHSISLTGGEPLEQVDFLKEWLVELKTGDSPDSTTSLRNVRKSGTVPKPKIYLETNGLLPAHLSEVIDLIDIIGMDIKLPSVAGVKPFWNLHRDFLKTASKREVFVKVVVDSMVAEDELMLASELVYSVDVNIPFIIQPRTPIDMDAGSLLRLQEIVTSRLLDVRVIPQLHKFLNLR